MVIRDTESPYWDQDSVIKTHIKTGEKGIRFSSWWVDMDMNPWLIAWLVDSMIDWLINQLIDWPIDWLTIDWLIDYILIYWLIDWLIDWITDWLIDWLPDWLTDLSCCYNSTYFFLSWWAHGPLWANQPECSAAYLFGLSQGYVAVRLFLGPGWSGIMQTFNF